MRVRDVMTSPTITVGVETPIKQAWEILQEHGFRHLPVVRDDRLVGTISDRDVRAALAREEGGSAWCAAIDPDVWRGSVYGRRTTRFSGRTVDSPLTVRYIMHESVVTVPVSASLEEAGRLLLEHKIGALPVVDGERLVGIVSEDDVLRALIAPHGNEVSTA
jgi:acetoin utilization protein AcuB